MKKLLFLCSFVLCAGMMNAQTCNKSAKKSCAKTCTKKAATTMNAVDGETKVASAVTAADIAAEADPTIMKKVCEKSGSTSFFRESTCAKSGDVSLTEVKYCTDAEGFINVSPKSLDDAPVKVLNASNEVEGAATGTKKACSKKCSKTCSKKKGATEQ